MLFFFLFGFISIKAQMLRADLPNMPNQLIELKGFNGLNAYTISQSKVSSTGNLEIQFDSNNYGLAFLQSPTSAPFYVVLDAEGVHISGKTLLLTDEINVLKGAENKILSGQLKDLDNMKLQKLKSDSYLYRLVQLRNLDIGAIEVFRSLDFADDFVLRSGYLPSLIEQHFSILQQSENNPQWIENESKNSIRVLLKSFENEERRYNQLVDYLFNLFENLAFYEATEFLSVYVLEESTCALNPLVVDNLEAYQKMKIGNKAPNIHFKHGLKINGRDDFSIKSLYDITTNYRLLVFGTSWCNHCQEEIPMLAQQYEFLKSKGVEVIYIALDIDLEQHLAFSKNLPFVVSCMCKLGEQEAANDYFVRSTPSLFLLNAKHEIVLRPFTFLQLQAWIKSNLN